MQGSLRGWLWATICFFSAHPGVDEHSTAGAGTLADASISLAGSSCESGCTNDDFMALPAWMDANQIGWAAWKLDDCDTEDPPHTSCLPRRNAPLDGSWSNLLNGHASYVVGKLLN